jgi:hypothetical protein
MDRLGRHGFDHIQWHCRYRFAQSGNAQLTG